MVKRMYLDFLKPRLRGKEKLIKKLGGYTDKEYRELEQRYNNILVERTGFNAKLQAENEAIYKTLTDIEMFMKSLYGIKPEKWASKVFHYIQNNRFTLLIYGLNCKALKSRYKMDDTLTKRNSGIRNLIEEENEELEFILENDN